MVGKHELVLKPIRRLVAPADFGGWCFWSFLGGKNCIRSLLRGFWQGAWVAAIDKGLYNRCCCCCWLLSGLVINLFKITDFASFSWLEPERLCWSVWLWIQLAAVVDTFPSRVSYLQTSISLVYLTFQDLGILQMLLEYFLTIDLPVDFCSLPHLSNLYFLK